MTCAIAYHLSPFPTADWVHHLSVRRFATAILFPSLSDIQRTKAELNLLGIKLQSEPPISSNYFLRLLQNCGSVALFLFDDMVVSWAFAYCVVLCSFQGLWDDHTFRMFWCCRGKTSQRKGKWRVSSLQLVRIPQNVSQNFRFCSSSSSVTLVLKKLKQFQIVFVL